MRFESPVTRTSNTSKKVFIKGNKIPNNKTRKQDPTSRSLGTWIQQYRAKVSWSIRHWLIEPRKGTCSWPTSTLHNFGNVQTLNFNFGSRSSPAAMSRVLSYVNPCRLQNLFTHLETVSLATGLKGLTYFSLIITENDPCVKGQFDGYIPSNVAQHKVLCPLEKPKVL